MGVSKMPLLGMPRAVKKASLPTSTACSMVPGAGGVPDGTSRAIKVSSSRSMMLNETLTSLLTYARRPILLPDDDPVGDVADLEARQGRRTSAPAHELVAATTDPADATGVGVGVQRNDVVEERPQKAGGGIRGRRLETHEGVHVERRHLGAQGDADDVQEGLDVGVKVHVLHGRLRLGPDAQDEELEPADQERAELIREHALWVLGDDRTPGRRGGVRAEGVVNGNGIEVGTKVRAIGGEAGVSQRLKVDARDRRGGSDPERQDHAPLAVVESFSRTARDQLGEEQRHGRPSRRCRKGRRCW